MCDKLEYKDMRNNTPETLRLARMIEHYNAGVGSQRIVEDYQQAADELRRLYFENEKFRAALAEQPAEQEPVAWEWRWFDTSPYTVTSGQWSEWKRVEPRNSLCTLDDALNEFRAYIANGLRYELRAIYTAPQPRRRLTDEEIDTTTRKQVDDLLDHIYEYGTAAEGIIERVRAIARAIEAAHGIGGQE